jgi:hypothetical protein
LASAEKTEDKPGKLIEYPAFAAFDGVVTSTRPVQGASPAYDELISQDRPPPAVSDLDLANFARPD